MDCLLDGPRYIIMTKFNADQLRKLDPNETVEPIKRFPLYFILDDVWDTYNIGGIFRLADALAVEKIYICGQSEIPPNHKIAKASVGTYKIVPWEYRSTAVEAIEQLRTQYASTNNENDLKIISIEQADSSIPYTKYDYSFPLALIVGNETHGVCAEALAASDAIVELPMHGVNKSLNVIVSAAIVGFHVYNKLV